MLVFYCYLDIFFSSKDFSQKGIKLISNTRNSYLNSIDVDFENSSNQAMISS